MFGAWYAYEGAGRLREIVQSRVTLALALLCLAFSLAVTLSWHIKALEGSMPDALSKLIYRSTKATLHCCASCILWRWPSWSRA